MSAIRRGNDERFCCRCEATRWLYLDRVSKGWRCERCGVFTHLNAREKSELRLAMDEEEAKPDLGERG